MAVQNKPDRPIPRPTHSQPATPQRPSIQKAVAQTKPPVNRRILDSARNVYAHNGPTQKPVHAANAKYSVNSRPQSPLKVVTKDIPGASGGDLISHSSAVDFLDSFLARAGKIRAKA